MINLNSNEVEKSLEQYFDKLWPINRSITGNGNRLTLKILSDLVDFNVLEIPSGTKCFDWEVPKEWNINDAWIKNSKGDKIVDFKSNNLHIVSYSAPIHGKMDLTGLKKHLYSLPEQPEVIPYLTSYYKEMWGFCISHNQLTELEEDTYEVYINSSFNSDGSLTIGEAYLEGETDDEILLSTYICHPSMANNELSGPLVTSFIYDYLKKKTDRRYSYRFLFIPETIGAITYLSLKGLHLKEKLKAGFIVTCVGDRGNFTFKRTRNGNAITDRATEQVLLDTEDDFIIKDFNPASGSDEKHYCSPGFDLPIGSLMRTEYGLFKEYHTSGDNKSFISFQSMRGSIEKYLEIISVIEYNRKFKNLMPFCEPQFGKRGLFPTLSPKFPSEYIQAMRWILNLSDGNNDLIDIAAKSQMKFSFLMEVAENLRKHKLVGEIN